MLSKDDENLIGEKSNELALEMVVTRSLVVAISRRQLRFVGHVVKKEGLEKLALE